jgi:outer membrane protein assembly factor BamB
MAATSTNAEVKRDAQVRWLPALVIVLLAAVAVAAVWFWPRTFRGLQVVGTMIATGVGLTCLAVWFLVFSNFSGRVRTVGAVLILLALATTIGLLRIDDFDGDMLPIVVWRWTPTAEELFLEDRARRAKLVADEADGLESHPTADGLETHPTNETSSALQAEPGPTQFGPPVELQESPTDYAGYLGNDRHAWLPDVQLELDWQAHPPRELWRRRVGLGWSAFAVVGDYAVTQEQRGELECVVCYEVQTGRERWVHTDAARFEEALGGDGPRATPAIHAGRVVALGATGILNCLDGATGQRLWSHDILQEHGVNNISWGMAGSPLVVNGLVVVCPGGGDGHSLVAYRLEDGRLAWHAGSDPAAYASPQLTQLAGVPQILILNAAALCAHEPATGRLLWRYAWESGQAIKCSQPLVPADFGNPERAGQVLISSGYAVGSLLLSVEQHDNHFTVRPTWPEASRQLRSKFANLVARGDYVYGLDEGILTCIDLATGARRWKGGRYGHGQMILAGDTLLLQAENGDVVLLEAAPDAHRKLADLPALTSKTWNPPALSGRHLLVRNDREAACFELPLKRTD